MYFSSTACSAPPVTCHCQVFSCIECNLPCAHLAWKALIQLSLRLDQEIVYGAVRVLGLRECVLHQIVQACRTMTDYHSAVQWARDQGSVVVLHPIIRPSLPHRCRLVKLSLDCFSTLSPLPSLPRQSHQILSCA